MSVVFVTHSITLSDVAFILLLLVNCDDTQHFSQSLSTKYLSLFILSVAYLLLNAASYDGEILHTDA